jgi:mannan endo-1,4-beta-mannosidase
MFWDGTRWIDERAPTTTRSSTRGRGRVRLRASALVLACATLTAAFVGTSAITNPTGQALKTTSGQVASLNAPGSRGPEPSGLRVQVPSLQTRPPVMQPGAPSTASPTPPRRTTEPRQAPAISAPAFETPVVQRSGTVLMLDGQPFRFTGINIYMAASGGTPSSCGGELYPDVGVPLSEMPSGTVIRFWAFQSFFVAHGSFDWSNFDQVLRIAAAHGDKVIPVLANQYGYCDGATKDLAWYQGGYKTTVSAGSLVTYRRYVSDVVTRYVGNPTVAMWQLVNEGQAVNKDGSCDESTALRAMLAFSNDVGGMAHGLDPSHLVSLGTLAGYSGSGRQWCGAFDADYQTLMASPGNDVCDFHDYGYPADPMGMPFGPDLASAVRMCHAVRKPIMVGETGIYANSAAGLAPRAAQFHAKLSAQFAAGVVGELMWAWSVKPHYVVPAQDPDYGISPGDPSLEVLGTR